MRIAACLVVLAFVWCPRRLAGGRPVGHVGRGSAAWDMQLERILAAMLARMPPENAAQMKAAGVDPAASFKEAVPRGWTPPSSSSPAVSCARPASRTAPARTEVDLRATTCGGGRRRRRARGHGRQGRRRPDHAAPTHPGRRPRHGDHARDGLSAGPAPLARHLTADKTAALAGRPSVTAGNNGIAPLGKRTSAALSSGKQQIFCTSFAGPCWSAASRWLVWVAAWRRRPDGRAKKRRPPSRVGRQSLRGTMDCSTR